MITAETYTVEWLDAKVKELDAQSYDLAEKMVYALTLLEQLKRKGLDFIFKGGTSLILLFDGFNRFSKDIDILLPQKPENLHQVFDAIINDTPFLRWEKNERPGDAFGVPKEHYKFIYHKTKNPQYPEEPVLLDIIYVESTYPETTEAPVKNITLKTDEPHTTVTIPTINAITGDKLTAFAPNTIGIPAGQNKAVEIAKQLFDLDLLFERVINFTTVQQSFAATAAMVIKYYGKNFSLNDVYNDIIQTAFTMAMGGKENEPLFKEIKTGVTALNSYLSRKTHFTYDKAVLAAAKMAYLAACFQTGAQPQRWVLDKATIEQYRPVKIEHEHYKLLNKPLKAGYPLAWLYWHATATLLTA